MDCESLIGTTVCKESIAGGLKTCQASSFCTQDCNLEEFCDASSICQNGISFLNSTFSKQLTRLRMGLGDLKNLGDLGDLGLLEDSKTLRLLSPRSSSPFQLKLSTKLKQNKEVKYIIYKMCLISNFLDIIQCQFYWKVV